MSYPAPLWSVLEEVLKPQHIFAQNMEESIYIRFLNLDSATVPFFSLMLASLLNFISERFLAFACQVRECLQLSKRKQTLPKGLRDSIKALGEPVWDVPSPATISRSCPGSSNMITEGRPQTRAQESVHLQHWLASLTSGRSFLHVMLKVVEQQYW